MKHKFILPVLLALLALLALFSLFSCGSSRKSFSSESSTTVSERMAVDRATKSALHAVEKTTETSISESGSERVATTAETVTTVEFSLPDSLGRQHKLRETTTMRKIDETGRTDFSGKSVSGIERATSVSIVDSLHVEKNARMGQAVAVTEEKKRKSSLGGYFWAFGVGVIATVGAGIGVWIWRKYRTLSWMR